MPKLVFSNLEYLEGELHGSRSSLKGRLIAAVMLALLLGNLSLHIQSTVDESHSWFLSPRGLQESTVWE